LQLVTDIETTNTATQVLKTAGLNDDRTAHPDPVRVGPGNLKLLKRRVCLTLEYRYRYTPKIQEANRLILEYRDMKGKEEAEKKKLIDKDAEENDRNIRKREEEKKEKTQRAADKKILSDKKASGKKAATPRKETKKTAKLSPAARRIVKMCDDEEKKRTKKEKEVDDRREFLISEGLTTVKMLDDDDSVVGDDDMEWTEDQYEVVDHAVDWKTAKGNFRVIIGMRAGESESTEMWMWGQRTALLLDGMDESKLDKYIQENCDHPVYREHLNRVVRKKDSVIVMEKAKTKKQCDHSSYDLGLSYNPDAEVNPGWCVPGKFLFGVECAGCGSPFVQKAPPTAEGCAKKPGDPQVPSTTNAVYCCINLRNRNGTSEEGCSHALCRRCWDGAVLKASKSDGPRASRRGR
jgi:hypothetical protein